MIDFKFFQAAKSLVRLYSTSNLSNQRISKSGIQFRITNKCFSEGRMKIRCTAHIYDIYWQSTEVSVEQEKNKLPVTKETEKILDNHYHQPPPNFQLGQNKLDGQVDVKGWLNIRTYVMYNSELDCSPINI